MLQEISRNRNNDYVFVQLWTAIVESIQYSVIVLSIIKLIMLSSIAV